MKLILVSTSLFILWNLESASAADELPVFDFPANEYIFSVNRDALIEAEKKFEHRDSILTEVS